jgi:hypothetical protein
MVPENPDSAGNGLLGEDSPVGTVLHPGSLAIIAGKEANPSPPPVFAPLATITERLWQCPFPMRCMVGILKELRRIGGWGSGSPLTRAFAGLKPLQKSSLPAPALTTRLRLTGPYLRRRATGGSSKRDESPSPWSTHTCAVCYPPSGASPFIFVHQQSFFFVASRLTASRPSTIPLTSGARRLRTN